MRSMLLLLGAATLLAGAACHEAAEIDGLAAPEAHAQTRARSEQPAPRAAARSMRDLDKGPPEHMTFRSDDLAWRDGPPSLEPGAQVALLDGDPSKDGVFTMRIRFPDGYEIRPHWHPNVERVTVLRGTFHLGEGETMDRARAEALPAGSYTTMPKRMVHHVFIEGETVIQISTVGPWEINYVRPEDDPRQRERAPRAPTTSGGASPGRR